MDDLISRQDAIDDLRGKDPSQIWDTADIEVWVNALPSAQPKITRCKDCKWKNRHNCTRAVEVFIDDDKYCAWAERRIDDER